jgi:hypothetical protein
MATTVKLQQGTKQYRVTTAGGTMHVFEAGSDRCLSCLPRCKKPAAPVRRETTMAATSPYLAIDLARLRWFAPSQGYRLSEGMATRLGERMAAARRHALEQAEQDRKTAVRLADLKTRWEGVTGDPDSDGMRAKAAGAAYADRKLRAEGLWPADGDTTGVLRWYEIAVSAARLAYETGAFERVATMPTR